jgi:hypothetical protein
MSRFLLVSCMLIGVACLVASCGKEEKPGGGTGTAAKKADEGGHHSGKVIELGSSPIGAYSVRASRDEGEIKPGGDSPIDVWVDGTPKVKAVRFWIGTEDAKGSVKALAAIEFPDQPNHWHTHADVPKPLPPGSRIWVEIEDDAGKKSVGSFDLKTQP